MSPPASTARSRTLQLSPPRQQRALRCAHSFYQRGEVREAADTAVAPRRALEIEMGAGMGQPAPRADPEMLEQRPAHEVRWLAPGVVDPEVDVGLAEMGRQQLRMAVGEVEQGDVAGGRQIVEAVLAPCGACAAIQRQPVPAATSELAGIPVSRLTERVFFRGAR